VAERIFSDTKIEGWGFDIEVLALARAFNYKIGIIPAHWVNDARSHVRWFDYVRVLGDTLRVRAKLISEAASTAFEVTLSVAGDGLVPPLGLRSVVGVSDDE
jgi:hypothetical protein